MNPIYVQIAQEIFSWNVMHPAKQKLKIDTCRVFPPTRLKKVGNVYFNAPDMIRYIYSKSFFPINHHCMNYKLYMK